MSDTNLTNAQRAAKAATQCVREKVQFDREVDARRNAPEQLHAYLESTYYQLPRVDDPNVSGARWSRPPSSQDYYGHIQSYFKNACRPLAR